MRAGGQAVDHPSRGLNVSSEAWTQNLPSPQPACPRPHPTSIEHIVLEVLAIAIRQEK